MGQFNITLSLWYIKHHKLIDFIIIIFLLVINFLIGLYIFKLAGEYLTSPLPREPDVLVQRGRELKDIEILRGEAILNGNVYDLVAQVKNPNPEWGLQKLSYKFILFDLENTRVQEVDGLSYILPGETKYIIRTEINPQGKKVNRVELKLFPGPWFKKMDIAKPEIITLKDKQKIGLNEVGQLELFAIAVNQSYYHFQTVEVNILCFDQNNSILGVNYTTLNNFYAQTKREFRVRWNTDFKRRIANIVIEMDTNMFDPKNYTKAEENDRGTPSEYRDI